MSEMEQDVNSRTAAERAEAGEQLVVPGPSPQVRHLPRHPGQREGAIVSLCRQPVVWMLPDAPVLRGRVPLVLCSVCDRYRP